MSTQYSLFDNNEKTAPVVETPKEAAQSKPVYPNAIAKGKRVTSKLAAEKLIRTGSAAAHRQKVLETLRKGNHTGDEIAVILGMKTTQVRPRLSNLEDANLIEPVKIGTTILKRENRDGNLEIVWRVK